MLRFLPVTVMPSNFGNCTVMTTELQIDTMKFYSQVERVYNELRAIGFDDDSPLDVETLFEFDQYHFFGIEAVDDAINSAKIRPGQRVLDVSSGLGGPARYLAHTLECDVTAVELQNDVHRVAVDLTRRCGLEHKVHHVCADFLSDELELGQYDTVVSWFVFLHIADRSALLSRCMDCLCPGGFLYVNDFHEIDTLTSEEKHSLEVDVFCNWLPSIELFHQQCAQAGFASVETVDKTAAAIEFTRDRESAWDETRER
jgi:2-polyprenyl-3-methyl-5-hydroxy-6-metoxy-1,4-benzoquinol methylase